MVRSVLDQILVPDSSQIRRYPVRITYLGLNFFFHKFSTEGKSTFSTTFLSKPVKLEGSLISVLSSPYFVCCPHYR